MTPFSWNWRGRVAYSPTSRNDMQEYNGWWRHVAFGLYVFRRKAVEGWE